MNGCNNNRASNEHWCEYIKFLGEYPCMINEDKRNDDLWGILTSRLNKVNGCRKSEDKWKESIKNWRGNAVRKNEEKRSLSDCETQFMKLLKANNKKGVADKKVKVVPKDNKPLQKPLQDKCKQHKYEIVVDKPNIVDKPTDVIVKKKKDPQEVNKQKKYEDVHSNGKPIEVTVNKKGIWGKLGIFNKNQKLLSPLNIYYQNVRGLRTKLEKISNAVLMGNYDIIVLTETWLLPGISSHRVFDDRYFVFRTDRSILTSEKTDGGGVLIAVLKTHGMIRRHHTSGGALEEVWITLVKYDLVLGAVYFPPRTTENKFKDFLASANTVTRNKKKVIIGDFNMRRITWLNDTNNNICLPSEVTVGSFKTLLNGLKLLGVEQRNNVVNSTGVILDLVYTNMSSITITTTDSPFIKPDYHHPPLKIQLSLKETNPTGG